VTLPTEQWAVAIAGLAAASLLPVTLGTTQSARPNPTTWTGLGAGASAGLAVAELAEFVAAPALDPARVGERAGVLSAGRDRDHAARETGDVNRGMPVGRRPVPELAVAVAAPALDAARNGEDAGVVVAEGNGRGNGARGGSDRRAPGARADRRHGDSDSGDKDEKQPARVQLILTRLSHGQERTSVVR